LRKGCRCWCGLRWQENFAAFGKMGKCRTYGHDGPTVGHSDRIWYFESLRKLELEDPLAYQQETDSTYFCYEYKAFRSSDFFQSRQDARGCEWLLAKKIGAPLSLSLEINLCESIIRPPPCLLVSTPGCEPVKGNTQFCSIVERTQFVFAECISSPRFLARLSCR
jgi:hypothetical protein